MYKKRQEVLRQETEEVIRNYRNSCKSIRTYKKMQELATISIRTYKKI